ncbi:MAG: hypothetical protein ACJ8FS_04865 [Sphingomicrobium sp.]
MRQEDAARFKPGSLHQHKNYEPHSVSAWRDALVTVLLGGAATGILAFFLGWFTAIAVITAAAVVLALFLNSVIKHTIEF